MNWALELHDSEIIAFHEIGDQLFCFLDGYLHASENKPAIDLGSGYVQALSLCFDNGALEGAVAVWPADVYEGKLTVGEIEFHNILSLPFEVEGDASLELVLGACGEKLRITGSKLTVTLLGAPHYVEEFRR